ncbi:response regulator transcription factor [Paenibacillus selenitireducens]|nr:response regulator transcription factor [Paenibacillus selenitireducens]
MSKLHILIVDDEWKMRNLLRIYLMREGFNVHEAATGHEAFVKVKQMSFDLILLDIMMPDMNGWEVCRNIREISNTPIIMLTARVDTKDKVQGLAIGADDYITKPFESEELLARIHALIRRSKYVQVATPEVTKLEFRGLEIFVEGRQVTVEGRIIDFTQKEFDVLTKLATHRQRVYQREELVEQIWGYDYNGDVRVVDTHIKNIREKVQRNGLSYNPIQTVWGIGYKFNAPQPSA